LWRYHDFCDFQDGGRRYIGFSKIRNFNARCAAKGQISSQSVNRLQSYCDLTVFFKNGGGSPSWICWARIKITHGVLVLSTEIVHYGFGTPKKHILACNRVL